MQKISHFHNWLAPLPPAVLSDISQYMFTRTLEDGEAIYHLGEEANELYQVVEGKVKCNMYSFDGKEVVISTFLPGDTFGELGLLDGLSRAANTFAIGKTKIKVLSKQHFCNLSKKHPEINAQLVVMFSHRMRMAFTVNIDNLTLTLRDRLARCIHRIAVSRSINATSEVLMDISHEELARMVGASRQSVSKELKKMEKEGTLEIKYGKILVKDYTLLSEQFEYLLGQEQITPDYDV